MSYIGAKFHELGQLLPVYATRDWPLIGYNRWKQNTALVMGEWGATVGASTATQIANNLTNNSVLASLAFLGGDFVAYNIGYHPTYAILNRDMFWNSEGSITEKFKAREFLKHEWYNFWKPALPLTGFLYLVSGLAQHYAIDKGIWPAAAGAVLEYGHALFFMYSMNSEKIVSSSNWTMDTAGHAIKFASDKTGVTYIAKKTWTGTKKTASAGKKLVGRISGKNNTLAKDLEDELFHE